MTARSLFFLLLPEPFGDVFKLAGGGFAVHALIGGALAERSEMTYVGSYLDVVEVGLHDEGGNAEASAVPRHFEGGMMLVDVLRQTVDGTRVGIATHEGYAGDVFTVFLNEGVDGGGVERQSDVLPQVVAMTARTVARTVGQVDGKRHFVRHLLKDYSGIDVLQHHSAYGLQLIVIVSVIVSVDSLTSYLIRHSSGVLLPADVAVRSCSRA